VAEVRSPPAGETCLSAAGGYYGDLARLSTGFGAQNLAIVKHMARNLLRHPTDRRSLKNRRKLRCLNADDRKSLISQQPALT
jgi:hypothetical protein